MGQNRNQRRANATVKTQSKNELLARATAAEGTAGMFRELYENQIRMNERTVIDAEQAIQQSRAEQRATERTVEIMLFLEGADGNPYSVEKRIIDEFNAQDELGDFFVNVEQEDEGFAMTLIFEKYEVEVPDESDTDNEASKGDDGDPDETE